MEDLLELTVCVCYDTVGIRRMRLLKLLRIALIGCLFMAWTYGIAVAAAFVQEGSGAATLWMLEFVIFTVPATVLLLCVWIALRRLTRSYDYCIRGDQLEIWDSRGNVRRKLVAEINCCSIAGFAPVSRADGHSGRVIRATVNKKDIWALDVRHDGWIVRVLLQPDAEFVRRLNTYLR